MEGLDAIAADAEGDPPVAVAEPEPDLEEVEPFEPEPAGAADSFEPEPADSLEPPPTAAFDREPGPPGGGEIAALRDEVDALRRDLQEAVAQMSRDIERAERVAADRARKEARRQGRKSERAARRAAKAAMDTPDDPT